MTDYSATLAMLLVFGIFGLIVLFIPAFIAFNRKHPNRWAIAVICLAFGGTIIGWFGALIWAMQAVHKSPTGSQGGESGLNIFANDPVIVRVEPTAEQPTARNVDDAIEKLERLKQLADQGALTAEEFTAMRRSVLSTL